MNILVTGGAGFIGSHLIKALLKEGHTIVCVDNMNEYYDPTLKYARLEQFRDKIEFHPINIVDRVALETVFRSYRFDKVCHLAAQAGVLYSASNPHSYVESNIVGTANVFEFSRKYHVSHIVFASTSSVYGITKEIPFKEDQRVDNPVSIYAATKRSCELLASNYCYLFNDFHITCLRFFTVYGPFGRPDMALFKFTKSILEGKPIDVYNNGEMRRDFTYVEDIVRGFVLALSKENNFSIYNLGRGRTVWLMDFIKILEKKLGRTAKINLKPMIPGDVPITFADTTKAKNDLGFGAPVSVEDGVSHFVDWYTSYYSIK